MSWLLDTVTTSSWCDVLMTQWYLFEWSDGIRPENTPILDDRTLLLISNNTECPRIDHSVRVRWQVAMTNIGTHCNIATNQPCNYDMKRMGRLWTSGYRCWLIAVLEFPLFIVSDYQWAFIFWTTVFTKLEWLAYNLIPELSSIQHMAAASSPARSGNLPTLSRRRSEWQWRESMILTLSPVSSW